MPTPRLSLTCSPHHVRLPLTIRQTMSRYRIIERLRLRKLRIAAAAERCDDPACSAHVTAAGVDVRNLRFRLHGSQINLPPLR